MIFQLGKLKSTAEKTMGGKSSGEGSLGAETFRRWRDAAARIQGNAVSTFAAPTNAVPTNSEEAEYPGDESPESESYDTALDLQLDPRELGIMPTKTEQQFFDVEINPGFTRGTSNDIGEAKGVQWPDPRAAIALTKEITGSDGADRLYGPEIEGVRLVSSANKLARTQIAPAQPSAVQNPAVHTSAGQTSAGQTSAAPASSGLGFGGDRAQGADRVSALRSASTARPAATAPAQQAFTPPTTNHNVADRMSAVSAPSTSGRSVSAKDASMSLEEELRRRFGSNVKSALGPGTIIEGNFSFDSPVCIDGTLIGEVHSSSVLIVGENASVNAKISVGSLIVLGNVTGMVEAKDLVEIRAGGSLEGDIDTQRIAIEEGGWFQGRCNPRIVRSKKTAADD